jgi:hypothetical protein
MAEREQFEGVVQLAGRRWSDFVTPTLDEYGLDLFKVEKKYIGNHWHDQITLIGPHLRVWCISPSLVVWMHKAADYRFLGPSLGTKTLLWGVAARDGGAGDRQVIEVSLRVTFHQCHTEFRLSGVCGELLFPEREQGETQTPTEEFLVRFDVPDSKLPGWSSCGQTLLNQKSHAFPSKC